MSTRSSRSTGSMPANPLPQAIIEHGFVPVRAKLLEVAAFLDRVARYGVADDFRCVALREAVGLLARDEPDRARRLLEHLSDPTQEPETVSSGKAACGAWNKPA